MMCVCMFIYIKNYIYENVCLYCYDFVTEVAYLRILRRQRSPSYIYLAQIDQISQYELHNKGEIDELCYAVVQLALS